VTTRRRRLRGFGILEVMISGTMLVIGLAAAAQFSAAMAASTARDNHLVSATHCGEQTMERLIGLFPSHADLANGDHSGSRFGDDGAPSSSGRYQVSWTVQVGAPLNGLRRVDVNVTWLERGTPRNITLRTLRT